MGVDVADGLAVGPPRLRARPRTCSASTSWRSAGTGPAEELVRTDLQQPAILAVGRRDRTRPWSRAARLQPGRVVRPSASPSASSRPSTSRGRWTSADALAPRPRARARHAGGERGHTLRADRPAREADVAEAICAAARERDGRRLQRRQPQRPRPDRDQRRPRLPGRRRGDRPRRAASVAPTRLPVAGAFHSALMAPGAERLAAGPRARRGPRPAVPVISNVTARGDHAIRTRSARTSWPRSRARYASWTACGRRAPSASRATVEVAPGTRAVRSRASHRPRDRDASARRTSVRGARRRCGRSGGPSSPEGTGMSRLPGRLRAS